MIVDSVGAARSASAERDTVAYCADVGEDLLRPNLVVGVRAINPESVADVVRAHGGWTS